MRLSNLLTAIDEEVQRAQALALDDTTDSFKRVEDTNVYATNRALKRIVLWVREARVLEVRGENLTTLYQVARLPEKEGGHVVLTVHFGTYDTVGSYLYSVAVASPRGFDIGAPGARTSDLALTILSHHLHVAASNLTEFEALLAKANPAARRAWKAHARLTAKLADGSADHATVSNSDLSALLDSFVGGY